MTIRPEKPAESAAIGRLIETAFRTAKVADGDEHRLADRLRAGRGYVPELALVAEKQGVPIGHVMFTRFAVARGNGASEVLLVAPLSVALEHRDRGVGSALMREGLRCGREMGFGAALLVGDPAYYGRFGFRRSVGFGIRNRDGIPDRYVLALELEPGFLEGMEGTVSFVGL